MRAWCLVVLLPFAAHAEGVEFEISPGYAKSMDVDASTPLLRGRVGVDLGWLTPSVVGMAALFEDPQVAFQSVEGGVRAWAIAGDVRAHTSGPHQLSAGVGVGWGQLLVLQEQRPFGWYRGHPAAYVEATVGYRFVHEHWRVGVDLTVDVFNRLDLYGEDASRACGGGFTAAVCPTNKSFSFAGVALSLGWGN